MNKLMGLFLILSPSLFLTSCKKYLDVTPDNVATIDYTFRNRNEAENYLFTCYWTLQNRFAYPSIDPGFTMSGEIVYPFPVVEMPIDLTAWNLIRGTQNITSPQLNYWDGGNTGIPVFQAIRRCNIFLENIDKPVDLTITEKTRWIAEVKFLKAYYHFFLLRMYGPIPIIKSNLPIASSTEQTRVKRAPVDSVFNYIVTLLDEAAPDLPDRILNENSELGRITRPIVLAVKARVLATEASPLFNGNPDYSGFENKDGEALFSQTSDPAKWERAAEACKEAIDACVQAGIKPYSFDKYSNIVHASDSTRLLLTLRGEITDMWNSGIIWGSNVRFRMQYMCTPRLNALASTNNGIRCQFSVPIGEAELFYSNHGVPIEEDKTRDHASRYSLRKADSADQFYIKIGYTTVKANFDREPRFYADLGFDGGTWFGNGTLDDRASLYVQAKNGQPAGNRDPARNNITGYFVKKLVPYQSLFLDVSTEQDFYWPMMRLSGLYLLYAETLNEAAGPGPEVYKYLNMVRSRAGIPMVEDAWSQYSKYPDKYKTQEGLREIIHRETRIELCFEANIGWDLRRWKEFQTVINQPVQGWSIFESQENNYYRPQTLFVPTVTKKDYFWPIKDETLTINPNLVQNPGW